MDDGSDGLIPPSDGDDDTPKPDTPNMVAGIERRWYQMAERYYDYSTTYRWRKYAARYKELAVEVQKWSQQKKTCQLEFPNFQKNF